MNLYRKSKVSNMGKLFTRWWQGGSETKCTFASEG